MITDAATLARIAGLAIRPAYEDVWICTNDRGHLQATGRDIRPRKQYRYHQDWHAIRDSAKFRRMIEFGGRLPRLAIVSLLDTTWIRVVIAHEVGHHVQKLTGGFHQMETARGRASQTDTNQNSVRMELQADCYAGVWGHYAGTMKQLDSGDIAEALNAATSIGDDRLQKQTQGRVVPESFTHCSSEQRARWFKRGLDSGSPKDCDTFSTNSV